jgi:hypothetical protein
LSIKPKLLLLIFSISVILFGCKKEHLAQDPLTSAKKQIIGTWLSQSGIITYYDTAGKVVDTQTTFVGSTKYLLDANTLRTPDSDTNSFPYTLTDVDGKVMINVINESLDVSFSNDMMIWSQQKQYQNEAYSKSVYIIQFKKQ